MKSNESASCDRVNSVPRGKLTRCQNLPRPLLPIPSLISNDGRLFPRSLNFKERRHLRTFLKHLGITPPFAEKSEEKPIDPKNLFFIFLILKKLYLSKNIFYEFK
jgi:hypothetical protein